MEIAEVVGFELDDPRVQSATVTEVQLSPNGRDAKAFVLVSGTENEINLALRSLQRAAPFIRQQVALNLDLRHAPQIHFVRDTAGENAARVSEILEDLAIKGEILERNTDEG